MLRLFTLKKIKMAYADLREGLLLWPLWVYLAYADIRLRYRRSVLGPWWITISMAIFVATMGTIYGRLLKQDMSHYLPFLVTGFLIWTFISTTIIESALVFKTAQAYIKQMKLPLSIQLYRQCFRNLVIFAHNFLIYILVGLFFHISWHFCIWLAIPGLLLILMNSLWVNLLCGILGTRFQDIAQIINSLVTVAFFASPITWMPDLIGASSNIVRLNPITYFLDVVRAPLLGTPPQPLSFLVVGLFALVGWLITFLFFTRYRNRIVFWID